MQFSSPALQEGSADTVFLLFPLPQTTVLYAVLTFRAGGLNVPQGPPLPVVHPLCTPFVFRVAGLNDLLLTKEQDGTSGSFP